MSKFIASYTTIPKELFRINNGPFIHLRGHPGPQRPIGLFDILTYGGKVRPKALNPATYRPPNGASIRPNTKKMHMLAHTLRGSSVGIYIMPAGCPLPDDLIVVHEFRDHYSLQARKEMTLEELNSKITNFLQTEGTFLSKDEWLQQYPEPTEVN